MFQSKVQLVMCVYMLYSNFNAAQTDRLYFILQPPQLLQGDVMVSGHRAGRHPPLPLGRTTLYQKSYVLMERGSHLFDHLCIVP